MKSDAELLRQFAETRDNESFAELVQRHIRFVYAISLRRLRNAHAAQDATQAVFIALARKARAVAEAPSLLGWLHRSACYETLNLMRSQNNRRAREIEAHRLGTTASEARPQLEPLAAVLDDVLCEVSESEREAILARYFAERSYAEIAAPLRLTENAARMRVERALAKLRDQLERRGVTSTAVALAAALPAYASAAVPIGLPAVITKASLLSLSGGTGVAAILTFMSTTKVITGAAVALAVGGFMYGNRHVAGLRNDLADARAESVATGRKLETIQRELAELKAQRGATPSVAVAANAGGRGSSAPAVAVAGPPRPGVTPKAPKGWFKNGSANELYEVGVDENHSWGGMPSAYARSIGAAGDKFGGMMQTISADAYKNQRVRLTGWVKTEAAEKGGHLWLRIDGPVRGQSLQFDNMHGRAPKGTTDWEEYSIVLDVPAEATTLNYGFFVSGEGQMWVNGMTLTAVGSDVPATNLFGHTAALPKSPINLGFDPPTE